MPQSKVCSQEKSVFFLNFLTLTHFFSEQLVTQCRFSLLRSQWPDEVNTINYFPLNKSPLSWKESREVKTYAQKGPLQSVLLLVNKIPGQKNSTPGPPGCSKNSFPPCAESQSFECNFFPMSVWKCSQEVRIKIKYHFTLDSSHLIAHQSY